jgi:hypothetical protein
LLILVKPFGRCPFASSDFPAENPRTQTRNVPYTKTLAVILRTNTSASMTRLTLFFIIIILTSCKATRDVTTFEKVNNGQDLENVTLISFDNFFKHWVYNRKIQKIDLNVRELNKDNLFTYFGKPKLGLTRTKWTFFKVHSDTLTERFPNYKEFYGSELRDYLWTEVIPQDEVELWNNNRMPQQNKLKANCPYKKNKPIHNYSLIDKTVILTMKWEIECGELEGLKNKTYKASYDLLTQKHKNITTNDK